MGAGGALGTSGLDKNTSHKGLTVDYHEPGIANAVAQENQFTYQHGFWFQLSKDDKKQAKTLWGPLNPQALNRYSYVLNNPLRYTDPTGHYGYDYRFDLGPYSYGYLTPQTAMAYFIQHPAEIFPFGIIDITPFFATNPATIQMWHIYKLVNVNGVGGDNYVMVIGMTSTSFTFIILDPKSFEPVGSLITFSTYTGGSKEDVYLQVKAWTPRAMDYIDWFVSGPAYAHWEAMARKLSKIFFPEPYCLICYGQSWGYP
ncbi:MAG: hypothetical protein DLM69_00410 [Candidatus Chloroheliales bacterium]|nr:MAG: hypothetical protein DLM69_00410 [Chloroflexota bacterium]